MCPGTTVHAGNNGEGEEFNAQFHSSAPKEAHGKEIVCVGKKYKRYTDYS